MNEQKATVPGIGSKPAARSRLPACCAAAALCFAAATAAAGAVTLVEEGRPRAVIVVADGATLTAHYAAEELARHVEKATGATLEIAAESAVPGGYAHRVFVGVTSEAHARGLAPSPDELLLEQPDLRAQLPGGGEQVLPRIGDLERDGFVLRTDGADLFVFGMEDPALTELLHRHIDRSVLYYGSWPRSQTPPGGTLFGVYEILHRWAGVRWLWPGELGTHIPRTDSLVIAGHLDETHNPAVKMRNFGWQRMAEETHRAAAGPGNPDRERIGFTREGLVRYHRDKAIYLARHRIGRTHRHLRVRHEFSGWWERHGEEHPEWFMLNERGERGPLPGGSTYHVAPCVTNPEFQRYLLEEHWQGSGRDMSLGDVDVRGVCLCETCRSWDPERDDIPDFVRYDPVVSNRYARFWNLMAERAAEIQPDVPVTTFLYWNYMPAPVGDLKLHPNIHGEFVPWSDGYRFYPMAEEVDAWLREQWLGWRRTGIQMSYRPNTFHRGYVMPDFSTKQAGEFFQFAYENGMRTFHFDSLYGHWSTRGPMLYMFMRLAWKPDLDIDAVLDEYYAGFGPAEPWVREYFDYWEDFSRIRGQDGLSNPVGAFVAYPIDSFDPARASLERAMDAARAADDPAYAGRVEFLRLGMEHAWLSARFMATLVGGRVPPRGSDRFRAAQVALRELIRFRRDTEHLYISDLNHAAGSEIRPGRIDFDALLDGIDEAEYDGVTNYYAEAGGGSALALLMAQPREVADPWEEWLFRPDPQADGFHRGWYGEMTDPDEWRPITVPEFWSRTWAGDYLGYGWYRTALEVPDDAESLPLALLFEGVDEQAWVFVNGRLVGEHTVASERTGIGVLWNAPFMVRIDPGNLAPGTNKLTVLVHASVSNGGIWRGVRLFVLDDSQDGW